MFINLELGRHREMWNKIFDGFVWILIATAGILAAYDLALMSLVIDYPKLILIGSPIGGLMACSIFVYKVPKGTANFHFNPICVAGFFFLIFSFQFAHGIMPGYMPNFFFPV